MSKDYNVAPWTAKGLFSDDVYRRLERGGDCGSGVGRGWVPLVESLNAKLREMDPDYAICQIKEKFGGLRFYAQLSDAASTRERYEAFHAVIGAAEDISYSTCELCGRPGGLDRSYGWMLTLCLRHRLMRRARHLLDSFGWVWRLRVRRLLRSIIRWRP